MFKSVKTIIVLLIVLISLPIVAFFVYLNLFSAPQRKAEPEQFVVSLTSGTDIVDQLQSKGFIKSSRGFRLVAGDTKDIQKGAYKLSKSMNVWEVKKVLELGPYMKWVIIPEGLRKEEIAELFVKELGWSEEKFNSFVKKDTNFSSDSIEGVYFPDTYLISHRRNFSSGCQSSSFKI